MYHQKLQPAIVSKFAPPLVVVYIRLLGQF